MRRQDRGWRGGKAALTDFHKSLHSSRAFRDAVKEERDYFPVYQMGNNFRVIEATNGKGARKLVCTVDIF